MFVYSDTLIDHMQSPRNRGSLNEPHAVGHADCDGAAPSVTIFICVADARIAAIAFESVGCGATAAAGSMLTEMALGRTVDSCFSIQSEELTAELGGLPPWKGFSAQLAVRALQNALLSLPDHLIARSDP